MKDIYFNGNPSIGIDALSANATCHLVIDDNIARDFNCCNTNTYDDVVYTRDLAVGKYGTIMLPFSPDKESLERFEFYSLTEAADGYLLFDEVVSPKANTPYLYCLRDGAETATITGGSTSISDEIALTEINNWQVIGSFTNQVIETNNEGYYAFSSANNEFNRITKELTVKPFRFYLLGLFEEASKVQMRTRNGETTNIDIMDVVDSVPTIYDLNGRRINEPENGKVYIINGKKAIIK